MPISEIVHAIKQNIPPFNDILIKKLRQTEFDKLIEFIAAGYQGCAKVISPDLNLIGYRVLSPVERLKSDLRIPKSGNTVPIKTDEATLVAYQFQYLDITFEHLLYVPYILEDGSISVNGTRYECLIGMTEKLFSVSGDNTGFTTKFIRFPANFWNSLYRIKDIISEKMFVGNVVCVKLHQKFSSKTARRKPSAMLYLLCKYELAKVLSMFGFSEDSITYDDTESPADTDLNYYYFRAQKLTKQPMLLKVNRELMESNQLFKSIVVTIVYILDSTQLSVYSDMISNGRMIYKIILGKLIYSNNLKRSQALNNMEKHIDSVDDFLDGYTNTIMRNSGIVVGDIYEFLVYVVKNIDQIIMSNAPNNIFNKKLDTVNSVVIEGMLVDLYKRVYSYEIKSDVNYMKKEVVPKALYMKPRQIMRAKAFSIVDNIRSNPSVQSDNWLITVGSKIVKRLSVTGANSTKKAASGGIKSAVNRFHPSMMLLESVYGVGSRPGVNVVLNPYCLVDELGTFVKDEYTSQIESELNKIISR